MEKWKDAKITHKHEALWIRNVLDVRSVSSFMCRFKSWMRDCETLWTWKRVKRRDWKFIFRSQLNSNYSVLTFIQPSGNESAGSFECDWLFLLWIVLHKKLKMNFMVTAWDFVDIFCVKFKVQNFFLLTRKYFSP